MKDENQELPMQGKMPETPEGQELYEKAIILLYKDKFPAFKDMIEGMSQEDVPDRLSTIVVETVTVLAKKHGDITLEQAIEVGGKLFLALIEDLYDEQVIEQLDAPTLQQTFRLMFDKYVQKNPDKVSQEEYEAFKSKLAGMVQEQAQPQPSQGLLQGAA